MPSIEEMDVDGNGLISRQEFEDTMGDERHLLARAARGGGFIVLGDLGEASRFFVSLQRCLDIIYTSFTHIYTLHVFLHVLYCPFSCPWIGWDDYTDELTNVVFGL